MPTGLPMPRLFIVISCVLILGSTACAQAQPPAKSVAGSNVSNSDSEKFCTNIAPSAEGVRIAWQVKRLTELNEQVKQRLADLKKTEADARDWVARRESLLKSATDNLVAIYSKMQPDTAASQLTAMDVPVAASILSKLNPRVAGAILEQMDADQAGKLGVVLSAQVKDEKKS
jgi:flagellar motility protein MotE (MotC chaperone)